VHHVTVAALARAPLPARAETGTKCRALPVARRSHRAQDAPSGDPSEGRSSVMSYLMLPTEALRTPAESGAERTQAVADGGGAPVVAWAALVLVSALAGAVGLIG